ncbi:N-acetylglucosamine-6-phosphate deacetylase [Gracilibacillus alcaliphilus]|uniref:N-acetylglucosamine-6-phosphate deacetylase n=1 Tax=Gracilibacillus alcaliphilus TaxID=1401441 RepID=UPI001958FC55|nr:amidohydrolase family protein [Gracilibacillus alcaliphilus]MBM7679508.1 N-acetylglucosamine-6-phosphate deacetylase [Gracilibacillus alcaliphilus]
MNGKLTGYNYQTNQLEMIVWEEGVITDIQPVTKPADPEVMIAPGLIDIQVNGYRGIDFNHEALHEQEWQTVIKEMAEHGVTTFYPTVITNSFEKLAAIFQDSAKSLAALDISTIGGFHLEGPYISAEDGPRGAHHKTHIRPPDWQEFSTLQQKAGGRIKLVTLSPEWEEAPRFIEQAKQSGLVAAIGHTAATSEEIDKAVKAGASLSTHLGNGAHVLLPRHPNYLWDQLAEDSLTASVIADGHHLPKPVLKVVHRVKGEQMILVSDSVALAGLAPGAYTSPVGGEVILTESGRLHLKDNTKLLAGSAMNLLQGIQYLTKTGITHFADAWNKASLFPAKLLKLPQQKGISIGAPADLVVYDRSSGQVMETYKQGISLFNRRER